MNKIISLALFFILLTALINCGGGTEPKKDTTPPTVSSTSPVNNATNVSVGSLIEITFSENLAASTVTESSVSISGSVAKTVTLTDNVISVTPTTDLAYNTTFIVTAQTSITDQNGNALQSAYSFSFTTEEDPTSAIPEVVSTTPVNNTTEIPVSSNIKARFSKGMDASTINATTFLINDGDVSGTISYNVSTREATFNPTTDLEYDSVYTVKITTAVMDTFAISLADTVSWSFRTRTLIPLVTTQSPVDSIICGDTLAIRYLVDHPIGVESLQVFVDGLLDSTILGNSTLYSHTWDASGNELGSIHNIYARAFDNSGHIGFSDTISVHYQWEVVLLDGNEGFNPIEVPNDLRKLLARSTDSTLELRIEYATDWGDNPYGDTAVDLAIFFDADNNISTGRRTAGGDTLNDIGAEYRTIVGVHYVDQDGDHGFNSWNGANWIEVFDSTGFYRYLVQPNVNYFELGYFWDDFGDGGSLSLVMQNTFFRDSNNPDDFLKDFAPEKDSGHVLIYRESKFFGTPSFNIIKPVYYKTSGKSLDNLNNPFD